MGTDLALASESLEALFDSGSDVGLVHLTFRTVPKGRAYFFARSKAVTSEERSMTSRPVFSSRSSGCILYGTSTLSTSPSRPGSSSSLASLALLGTMKWCSLLEDVSSTVRVKGAHSNSESSPPSHRRGRKSIESFGFSSASSSNTCSSTAGPSSLVLSHRDFQAVPRSTSSFEDRTVNLKSPGSVKAITSAVSSSMAPSGSSCSSVCRYLNVFSLYLTASSRVKALLGASALDSLQATMPQRTRKSETKIWRGRSRSSAGSALGSKPAAPAQKRRRKCLLWREDMPPKRKKEVDSTPTKLLDDLHW